ncbi:hypothetical protein NDU88_001849 [Pleurodeles waltl]|uniref:Uncharacterized protein n=1 Tax=Pleurodeles waltl TaxID=8319 RepID=A0AAV7P959_PLEWA|nr:hypothetical protein NDU88_001849 [Pleurodeles waltl]
MVEVSHRLGSIENSPFKLHSSTGSAPLKEGVSETTKDVSLRHHASHPAPAEPTSLVSLAIQGPIINSDKVQRSSPQVRHLLLVEKPYVLDPPPAGTLYTIIPKGVPPLAPGKTEDHALLPYKGTHWFNSRLNGGLTAHQDIIMVHRVAWVGKSPKLDN